MKRFRPGRQDKLGNELRASRPEPSPELVKTLSDQYGANRRRAHLYVASRLSFAGALTVLMLGTLASFGGLGYAASSTKQAAIAVKKVVAPSRPQVVHSSAAQDQYAPQKVTICHKGHTITISRSALPAHLRHGDTIGPCPAGAGGVAGLGAGKAQGQSGGSLPFTGISLGATLLMSLLLLTLGLTLRRRADRKS
ncbi:MAG: hypothetical protein H0W90_09835 [Actinobacteria bacterium]|nr:hypothetical protein [Actinomycetota bacterium]